MAKGATTNKLKVEVRTRTGKGASRQARREGKFPAVLYGHGEDPRHLEVNAHDFAAVLRHSGTNAVLSLDIDGSEELALTKALAIHPVKRTITHADLIIVKRGEKVTVEVPVHLEGEADSGTLVTQDATTIEIEAEALSIPESLTVSIEGAEEGTQILAGQVALPSGVTLISDPEMLVVNIVAAPTAEELEAEGAGEAAEGGAAEAEGEGAEAAEGGAEGEGAAAEAE
ncbi:MAG: 50S ribosomal protein L25/general stress protein Ctc [Mycobacterium sp.]